MIPKPLLRIRVNPARQVACCQFGGCDDRIVTTATEIMLRKTKEFESVRMVTERDATLVMDALMMAV